MLVLSKLASSLASVSTETAAWALSLLCLEFSRECAGVVFSESLLKSCKRFINSALPDEPVCECDDDFGVIDFGGLDEEKLRREYTKPEIKCLTGNTGKLHTKIQKCERRQTHAEVRRDKKINERSNK